MFSRVVAVRTKEGKARQLARDQWRSPRSRLLDNFTLSGRNYALRDETASPPVYASLSSSVRYLGASAFAFSMNAA